ncbi:peroxiredoxin-like family protein [Oscillatoria sp. CS-180]|uniref:peroxiredoxin-like family protein n=1 Tax=Oscillatoria sp. CS-180 TaxID=3021720 RepID=UPI00232D212B|nr:peroxiredoxin-like family protein [Oscillatoria sp. CS-180]MDB9527816.1 peroxiredoxin-like family protein [Oscillatoria sp. CS-180]
MTLYEQLYQTQRQRVSDGAIAPILGGCESASRLLVLVWSQLGDFDSLEYAWWLQRDRAQLEAANITVRAIGIGDRASGQQFSKFTGFPAESLFVDPTATLHRELNLYNGLSLNWPGLKPGQEAWVNLMLMCAGVASPGTLREVLRGYTGDRTAPQLIADNEVVDDTPLPNLKGSFFEKAGGKGFQRPFELATLRLRNMTEVLTKWKTYVPDARYMTQRGGTFLFDGSREVVYEYRDPGILGFAENMSYPLSFLFDDQAEELNSPTGGMGDQHGASV